MNLEGEGEGVALLLLKGGIGASGSQPVYAAKRGADTHTEAEERNNARKQRPDCRATAE